MNHENDDLSRAMAALTIFDVWRAALTDGCISEPAPMRDGVGKSPFREDKKGGSFSISKQGKAWKDWAIGEDKGSIWGFGLRCWPQLPKKELADKLIDLSGIIRTPRPQPRAPAQASEQSPAIVSPELKKAASFLKRKNAKQAAIDRLYDQRALAMTSSMDWRRVSPWPPFVAKHWAAGLQTLRDEPSRVKKLAERRGWPFEWVWELIESDLLSVPVERWSRADRQVHQLAFRVDQPIIKGTAVVLDPIGYHQRFLVHRQGADAPEKKWLFLPSTPRKDPANDFERDLLAHSAEHNSTPDQPRSLVPPLPFVLGDLNAPKLLILTEGQWDAISIFGACGWFEDASPPQGVAVFGIRGNQGTEAFLTWWREWFARVNPTVWVIADNDAAGKSWREQPSAPVGQIRPPSLADRLRHHGAKNVITSWLKPGTWGKDFNDYYKAAKPTRAAMFKWMRRVGVINERGDWT